jgi:ribose/xylose/arabinose/galactoside ABC-type transport system permease subunit
MQRRAGLAVRLTKSREAVLLLLFVLMSVFFSIRSGGQYLDWSNLRFILSTMTIGAYITTGAAFLMITGCLDLAASSTVSFAGVVIARLLRVGVPCLTAIVLTLMLAAVVGALSAALIYEIKIPPFIATLGVSYLTTGSTLLLSKGFSVEVDDLFLRWFGTFRIFEDVYINLIFTIIILTVCGVALARTRFGRGVYIIGGNPAAAKLSGLKPRRTHYILYMINQVLCAVAGIIYVAKMGSSSVNSSSFGPFMGMTCALLGGLSFGGGSGNLGGALAGLLLLTGLNNGISLIRIPPYWQNISSAALLLLAMSSDYLRVRRRTREPADG